MDQKINIIEINAPNDIPADAGTDSIVLCDQLSSIQVLSICLQQRIGHVVQESNVEKSTEIKLSSSMIRTPSAFIKFPLSTIFGVEKPSTESEKEHTQFSCILATTDHKDIALDGIEQYSQKHVSPPSAVHDIRLAADELVTNCLYNAPYVNIENTKSEQERSLSQITIDPLKRPYVFAGHDKDRMIVGCTDYYGKLNVDRLMERIHRCYENGAGEQINFGPGGAGIGSFMIFDSCMSYYVAVNKEVSTTICCSFPLKMSIKARQKIPKNIHIIKGPNT